MPFECNTSYPVEPVAILYVLKTHHIQNSPLRQRESVCVREREYTKYFYNFSIKSDDVFHNLQNVSSSDCSRFVIEIRANIFEIKCGEK